jgi:tetratricopeptide (TPR) repeat protein
VILRPRQHVLAVQIEDDTGQPIRNVSVELVGGQAQNKGITDLNGRVVFKNYNLIPGEPYKLVISALNYQNGNFSFGEENLDNPQNPVRLTIPLRYEWTVSTDVPGAQITILDIRGKKVAEGTSPLRIKLPKGVFTVVARSGSQEKRESLNTANTRSSFRKVIVLKDPYDFVKKWADTHPGQVLPEDFANLLKGIKATSSNFVNSRLLLAKMYIQEERYRDAVKAYNEIFAGNKQAQYNPNLLFLAAQARMLYSEKLDPNSDEYRAILQEALEKYADVATAYMAHVPMKKKKEVYMRIKFLRGEIAQRLFFHYQEKNKYDLARLYREKALDHLVEFIHDYEALGNSSPLKTDFQQNYHRAQELVSTIKATGVY